MAVDVFTGQVIEEKERPARDVFTGGLITDKPDSSVYELTERLSQEAGLPQDNVKWHEYLLSADPTFNKKEGESTQDYAKRYTTGLVKTLKEYPSKPEAHAFEQGFSFAPSKKPEDIAQKKEHPIIYNTGRLAQTIVLASGFGKMTKAIAPIVTNSIPVFSKVFPKIARAMGGIAHSFVVGLGVGATKETIKQIRDYEKGVDVGKVTKEGLWTGAAFAPWGVIPTTEIGATLGESVLKAGLKRGGAAFGVVGASSTIVTLMRKGEITSEDLGWILVNATTAAVLNGYNAKQIAQANRGSRQHDFMIREMANKYRNVKPNASQKEAEAFAELAYGTGLTKNTYAYIKQIEDNVNPIYKRLQAEKAVVKPSTPSAKEGVPMPKTPVEAPLTPEIIPKEPIVEGVTEPLIAKAKGKTFDEFYLRTGGGKYNLDFIDKLGKAQDAEIVGTVGDFIVGEKTRQALGDDVLKTPIMVKKNISDKVAVLGAGGKLKRDSVFGKKGDRIILIDNKPSHIKTDIIATILEEAAHTKRAFMGREMQKIDLSKFDLEEYENLPHELSGKKFGEYLHKIKEDKSQLTDIWNKAQVAKEPEIAPEPEIIPKEPIIEPVAEGIKPLAVEAKKKLPTIKNFTNFESKESPIAGLEKEASRINGLRLSGKLDAKEANKQIQEINKKKVEYAKEKGIAITTTQSGKTRIAIRKSGFYAKEEIVKAPTVDTYSQFQPPSSMALMQDSFKLGGEFGPIYKEVWMPTKKSIVGSIESKLKFDKEFKAITKKHNFALTKENGILLSDMLEKKIKIPEKHKALIEEIRQYMDNKRDLANAIRERMGKSTIGYIENYVPHIQETSIWNELVGNDITITDNFDFIIPNQVKNPFAFKRLMEEMANPDRNFFGLVERYNSAVAKDMHINPAIENIKAYNTVLKDKGLFKSAKYWDEYIRVGLLGKQHKIDSAISVSPLVRRGLKKWKDILNKAFLAGKVSWNLATQPLSYISLTPTEAGYTNAITAVIRMFNKGIRAEVSKQSLSLRIKSQDILSDAIGEGREFANRIYRTKIDKWNDMVTMISSIEEQLLHQTSYIAGLSRAKELGYKGEDAQMFADLVAERTQSMYNKENRALILSSDITTGAIPFQSFATELSNHAKEILTKSKGAMQLNIRQRLGKLIRLLIGIWLGNQYSKALTGREKTTVGTFIPFGGETVDRAIIKAKNLIKAKIGGKEEYVTTRSPVSLLQQVDTLTKAAKDYLKYGDTKRLRKLAITFGPAIFGMGGGGQLSNLVDGIIADIDEEVKNVTGHRLFKVKDLESKIKAPIFGVWSTKGAREYWEKRNR